MRTHARWGRDESGRQTAGKRRSNGPTDLITRGSGSYHSPTKGHSDLEFRILGPLEVIRGRQALPLGSPRQRALLGLLLVHANEPIARDRLVEELWAGSAPRTVNAVLSVYLSRLRRLLADGIGEQPLLTQAAGYVLRVPPDQLDAYRFEGLLERGRRELASGEAERASLTLREALALWRGPPLADLAFEPSVQTEIARLEELRLTALEARIEADLALGHQDSLVAELEALVAAHPYREGLRAQLMLALYRTGRQAEALERYRRAHRAFGEELGIEPGPQLRELERAILRHDPSLEAPGQEAPGAGEEEREPVRHRRRFLTPRTVALAVALAVVTVAAVVAAAFHSSAGSREPLVLKGDSVVVVDPGTDTIADEIPVLGRPAGLATGEGSVWVGNRDDETLLRIDAKSRHVVHSIGLGVAPVDVEVGAGSVWVLSDSAVLRVDPAVNDVVEKFPLPGGGGQPWRQLEVTPGAVYVCRCFPISGDLLRIDAVTGDRTSVREGPFGQIAYGEGALWAVTGYEAETIERIDPETNAVVARLPLARIGEFHGYRPRIVVGDGAVWVASRQTLWRIDPTTTRFVGSVRLGSETKDSYAAGKAEGGIGAGAGAIWIASFGDGVLLRVDPESEAAKPIPLGPLIYPVSPGEGIGVAEGVVWVAVTSYAS